MNIKTGDTVEVIAGDDQGLRGTVHRVLRGRRAVRGRTPKGVASAALDANRDRVIVSGVNLIKKHQRPTGDVRTQVGIIEREAPVHASNVALVCPHCDRRTRVGHRILESGEKVRYCKHCDQSID
jgi:large subunit ribosomal protein L24